MTAYSPGFPPHSAGKADSLPPQSGFGRRGDAIEIQWAVLQEAAAAVALLAREKGPAIAHQTLLYPVIDTDFGNGSYTESGADYFLTGPIMRWFWEQYVGAAGVASPDPLAAPIRAESLAGLPSATIVTAEHDPLRDEGEAYAEALEEAGVPVTLRRADGMIHGFASMVGVLPASGEAIRLAATNLKQAFAA